MQHFDRDDLNQANETLRTIPFFPTDDGARAAVSEFLARVCPHKEALLWLSVKASESMRVWGGLAGLRDLLAQRYQVADADNPADPETIDWNQFPNHEQEGALPPPELRRLEADGVLMIEGKTAPPLPPQELAKLHNELLEPLLAKPWPSGNSDSYRRRDEELARQIAENGRHLTDELKAARRAQIEGALGMPLL